MNNKQVIVVDLGGTNIRAGLFSQGKIVAKQSEAWEQKDNLQNTLDQLSAMIGHFITPEISGIGIGVPSVVDTEKGIVYHVTNIPSWKEVPLKSILEKQFQLPVLINNDVNCFVLGEHGFGAAKGFKSVVGITIGTGLGAGIIIENKLYQGFNTGAGEIGMLPYLDHDLEFYCSNHFFEHQFQTTAKHFYDMALQGQKMAIDAWAVFGGHIAQAVKYAVLTFDPEVIVFGGSLSMARSFFEQAMTDSLTNFPFPNSIQRLTIRWSSDNDSNLLGAVQLFAKQ